MAIRDTKISILSSRLALSTSQGLMYGPGQHLARLEARVFLEEFLQRFPRYQVIEGSQKRILTATVRGLSYLDLEL